ncbi:MAG TPA: potassium channel protein [Proteobacteria bacterium]|nr:potassium channel protein [Pseudomonadota bacterium]
MPFFQHFLRWLKQHRLARLRLFRIFLLAVGLNIMFGLLFYLAEHRIQTGLGLLDAIWWAMVTMTTVGYGDFYPQTNCGRFLIAYPCMLVGIAIVGYLLGMAAEQFFEYTSKKKRGFVQITRENHIIICNFPSADKIRRLTSELRLHPLYEKTFFVIVSDTIDRLPDSLPENNFAFVYGSPTCETTLQKANLKNAAGVFILTGDPAGSDADAITFAIASIIDLLRREHQYPCKVVAELSHREKLPLLRKARVDGIVTPEGLTDCLLAQEFLYPGIHEIITQIVSNEIGSQFYILATRLAGHRVADIQVAVLKHPANLQVIGIIKKGRTFLNPAKDSRIEPGDKLIILAESRRDFSAIEDDILKNREAVQRS